jgi:cell fate regulator YaaT (PSP1 superfamily)
MAVAVGVTFKRVAKSYWFEPGDLELRDWDRVVVETTRGAEIGTVRVEARELPEGELLGPLKRVLRKAGDEDLVTEERNKEKAREAMKLAIERVKSHELPMKVIQAEYTFDASQITISFVADTRVDFRELVKDLAGQLRCRVQLYQVGARDQAKMIGGVGPCGLTLCCSTFLTEFAPISMKMAKDQSLFLNPVKFSGVCGKLMCCLKYEHDDYVEAKKHLPEAGQIVRTPKGQGRVLQVNVLKGEVLVAIRDGDTETQSTFTGEEVTVERTTKCSSCGGCSMKDQRSTFAEDNANGDMEVEELDLSELEG